MQRQSLDGSSAMLLKVFVIWKKAEARILQRSPKCINTTDSIMLSTTVACTRGLEILETYIETRKQTYKLVLCLISTRNHIC